MSVTKQALRVYVALSNLGAKGEGDVLDALLPFFEPVLLILDGALFDPKVFSAGIRKLYSWRFTSDIAQEFVPRMARKGYLIKQPRSSDYIVRYTSSNSDDSHPEALLAISKILDEFQHFPAKLNDLLHFSRTRDELEDILIRFLVSMNAYTEDFFRFQVSQIDESSAPPSPTDIEEGGRLLTDDEKYICARFLKQIVHAKPEFVPYLARLASIGLVTEVVEDFVKPTSSVEKSDLVIFLDAPMAQHYLGLSGKDLRNDVANVLDALKNIGCQLMMFRESCDEIARNLSSMLALPYRNRHGYTHEAMRKGEVSEEFVLAVNRDPERAVERAGITLRTMTIDQYPNAHHYFSYEAYSDFLSTIGWGQDILPREHDAKSMAYIMRMREGRSSSDLFNCRYVFATHNKTFARKSRDYCVTARLVQARQWGPVVHLIDLATLAWLRTGLNQDEIIPRGRLIGICDRILQLRPEVTRAVYQKLSEVTPDRLPEFEILLHDQRSAQILMDQTTGNQNVVTNENVEQLLEAMRQATVAKIVSDFDEKFGKQEREYKNEIDRAEASRIAEREAFQRQLTAQAQLTAVHEQAVVESRAAVKIASEEAESLKVQLESAKRAEIERLDIAIHENNSRMRIIRRAALALLLVVVSIAVINSAFSWIDVLAHNRIVIASTIAFGLLSAYCLVAAMMNKPILVVGNLLNLLGREMLMIRIKNRVSEICVIEQMPLIEYENGLAHRKRR